MVHQLRHRRPQSRKYHLRHRLPQRHRHLVPHLHQGRQ